MRRWVSRLGIFLELHIEEVWDSSFCASPARFRGFYDDHCIAVEYTINF